MDALPDELLLLVLSFVGDARTLVEAVPLVCKRWRRLQRDHRVWADVDLECNVHYDVMSASRALLHAPTARRLTVYEHHFLKNRLTHDDAADPILQRAEACRRLASALRRTRVVLTRAELASAPGMTAEVLEAAVGLLRRQRDHLRGLDVHLPVPPASTSLFEAVAMQRRLEALTVRMVVDEATDVYRGELAGGRPLPNLASLAITAEDHRGDPCVLPAGLCDLAADVIGAQLPALRRLELDMGLEGLDQGLAGGVHQLPRLEALVLRVHVHDSDADVAAGASEEDYVLSVLQANLDACATVAPLRRLQLVLGTCFQETPGHLRGACQARVDDFKQRRPNVEVTFFM
ncbi:hypothetical protein ONE63_008187 [Megalurothrips usitatus]|uniref:F-box domain-containing protein n=1 Tax=Megalurothrips usitatus TaxID=439358 RepID=A0AAV7XKD8_9NEOP|nr:hypothetical protein ONE63_008187 [Megalurothrips usitatus]